ncbi:MAG: beta-L-arabinofuranosidase domain-containing protein [Planctomycetota bacterium]
MKLILFERIVVFVFVLATLIHGYAVCSPADQQAMVGISAMASKVEPAIASNPVDGSVAVATSVKLSWSEGDKAQDKRGYLLFVGTNKTEVTDSFFRNHPNVKVYVVSSPEYELIGLEEGTTYYWRVDQVNESVAPGLWKGRVWSFSTLDVSSPKGFAADFNTDHDFLANDVGDTGWDGFVGKGEGETADRIASADGMLHVVSKDGRYEGGARPLGPLLYKSVTGDFKATVRIAEYQSISFNNCGIMARAADLKDAGRGEDWISVDYFPIYAGIYARMTDNNVRTENCNSGQGRSADKYLQLELIGNMFFLRHSSDGNEWKDLPCSPIVRNDLVNVPLQVGLFHATYSGNKGAVAFDDFTLEYGGSFKTARLDFPKDGQGQIPTKATLSWIPGTGGEHHDIYFGTSINAVIAANNRMPKGTSPYKGRQAVSDIDFEIDGLKDGTTYYWRIDEVAGEEIVVGEIWSFTTYDRNLADFAKYASTEDLSADWIAGGKADVKLVGGALQLNYNNATSPYYALAEYTFGANQDWMSSEFSLRRITIDFKGDPANKSDDKLYMVFEDNDWGASRTVVEYNGDPANLRKRSWNRWDIDLRELAASNPTFRLSSVKKMALTIGNPGVPTTGGSGKVAFAKIRVDRMKEEDGQAWPRYIQPEKFVKAVPFSDVSITGGLWRERMEVNRKSSLPHVWSRCEASTRGDGRDSKRLDNFRKVAGEMDGDFTGTYFNDSDVYKIIEGTAYSLQNHPDAKLEAYTDKVIDSIAGAQWDDGYLYTFYSLPEHKPEMRWTNVGAMHELYCAGHLFEAGVAYYKATGKRKLLDVSIKLADNICDTFGPGKKANPPGHQEIELALIKLYDVTGNMKYMDMARFFIDQRGHRTGGRNLYGDYSQDHIPFVEQEKGVGHSVRAGYLCCAATDIAMRSHDESYGNAIFRLWDNITNTKTYITGGIGQPGGPEGFANDYELGNGCYAETCSGIAFSMWNHRLHLMTGEGKYIDIAERTLLNNMLNSLSHEGDKHYYTNPLSSGGHPRWEWPGHDCACCPSNLVRTISSIGGYAYTYHDRAINVNMYMQGKAKVQLAGNEIALLQTTNYPWDGDVIIAVRPKKVSRFAIRLRIPGWARNEPMPGNLYKYLDENNDPVTLSVNGSPMDVNVENGYVTIERTWKSDDEIHLVLPMSIRRVVAHPKATADAGLVAIERGPIVYCAENKDNPFGVGELKLPDTASLNATFEENFFSGVVTITDNGDPKLKLIPAYLNANRGQGWMRVWIRRN